MLFLLKLNDSKDLSVVLLNLDLRIEAEWCAGVRGLPLKSKPAN